MKEVYKFDDLPSNHSIPSDEKLSQKILIHNQNNYPIIPEFHALFQLNQQEEHPALSISPTVKSQTNVSLNCTSMKKKDIRSRFSMFSKPNSSNNHIKNNKNPEESFNRKGISKYNAQKSFKSLHTILFIKKNLKKLSFMSNKACLKKLNQYHMNLIGDKTCQIFNKTNIDYFQNFQKMLSSVSGEMNEKFALYDEMISSASPRKSFKNLNFIKKSKKMKNFLKEVNRIIRKFKWYFNKIIIHFRVIRPDSIYKLMIDVFSLAVTLFCIFFIPIHNIFWIHQGLYSNLLFILFFIQLVLLLISLNVGYIDKGIIYTNRKLILVRFLGLETLSDILYLGLLFNTINQNDDLEYNYLKQSSHLIYSSVMLFLLIFKFFKLKQLINGLVDYLLNLSTTSTLILSLSQVCFFLIVCAHILACEWILITKYDSENGNYTWLDKFGLITSNWSEIYLYGFYWAVVTMMTVGYGDILPLTYLERCFAIIAMMITCCIFAYIMNTIGNILEELNNQRAYLRKQQNMVNNFFKTKKIDNKLQLKIRKHLVNVWSLKKENKIDSNSLVEMIPENFREEVLLQIYGRFVKANKVLKQTFSSKLLEEMTMKVKEKIFIPDDIIIRENTPDNSAYYYIHKGKVQLFYSDSYILRFLSNGEWFGELSFISGMPRKASARSLEYTSMFYFTRNSFMELLKKHHYDYEKFCYIKDRINIYGNNKELQVACFSCRSYTHITKECGFVSCQKTIYKSCSNEKDQTRLSVILKAVRKDRVKFNARINHNEIEKKGEIFYLDNPGILDFDNAHNNPDSATLYTPGIKSKDSSYVSFYDENSSEKKEDSPRICDMNINKRLQSSQGTLELILMKKESDKYELMLGFESMKSYDLYFPHNNSHSVMKKMK